MTRSTIRTAVHACAIFGYAASAAVTLYPAPSGAPASSRYTVTVNSQAAFVYDAQIPNPLNCSFAYFDMDAAVSVSVTIPGGFSSVTIRPRNVAFNPATSGNTVTFQVARPGTIALTINGSLSNPLFIFANPPEVNPPRQGDPGVTYYGPGIHTIGNVTVGSNETVYIAGGAIVRGGGFVIPVGSTGARILGRGILDKSGNATEALWCGGNNVTLDGIVVANQPTMGWTLTFYGCRNLTVGNVKVVSGDHWSNDGMDIAGCSNVTVNNCFIKTYDDGVTIKAFDVWNANVTNIKVSNCFFWQHWAHACVVGAETNTGTMDSITFKNMDVVMAATELDYGNYTGAMGIFHADNADISRVRFEDFRVDVYSANHRLINLIITEGQWSSSATRGQMHDIYFKNIAVLDDDGTACESLIRGFDATHKITNVTVENLSIMGNCIENAAEGNFTMQNTGAVNFICTQTAARSSPSLPGRTPGAQPPHHKPGEYNLLGARVENTVLSGCGAEAARPTFRIPKP